MKKNKSNLDEMQEMKLLKIEHNACWLAFWGLVAALVIQSVIYEGDFRMVAGETFVIFSVSMYLSTATIKNGIWDRKLKPKVGTNLLISAVMGAVVGMIWFLISYRNYHKLMGSVALFVLMFVVIFFLCFVVLSITAGMYQKQKDLMDRQAEQEENEE